MKKFILLALAALALPASAASINWTLNTAGAANYMVGADGNKLKGTAYLLLTSDLTSPSFTGFTSEQDIIDLALGGSEGSISITDGVNKTTKTTTDSRLTAPTTYSFTVLVYDSVGKSYFTTVAKEQAAYNLGADVDHYGTATAITLSAANVYSTSTTRGTQTYVPVPEPSSAALALAGLALLLKRRKA